MTEPMHVVCPSCVAINRVARERLGDVPRCASCKHALFQGKPVALDATTFERHLGRSDLPLVVDFWAPWCGPCLSMAPAFEAAARRLEPRMRLAKVDTESNVSLAARYGIRSIPTLIVFQEGQEVARRSGAMPLEALVSWLKPVNSGQ